ncbi:hypothetical protein [Lentibacillus amyloliquefaciens]|uniref:hypothetical protein n=1 Tax=Lentibacillus amyloliquefaciens TaxID=1472767 RepID=UPI0012E355DA|nr:hypothetical protein [Lentibacillus amyloliquefaciens]
MIDFWIEARGGFPAKSVLPTLTENEMVLGSEIVSLNEQIQEKLNIIIQRVQG